jgi:hypothetical protein
MHKKKNFILLITILSVVLFGFSPGCSESDQKTQLEKEKAVQERKREAYREKLRETLRREQEGRIQVNPAKIERKKNIATAEACQKRFESCVEHCENSACENSCLKLLSACEKTLPIEIQTLKKQQTSRQ